MFHQPAKLVEASMPLVLRSARLSIALLSDVALFGSVSRHSPAIAHIAATCPSHVRFSVWSGSSFLDVESHRGEQPRETVREKQKESAEEHTSSKLTTKLAHRWPNHPDRAAKPELRPNINVNLRTSQLHLQLQLHPPPLLLPQPRG